MSTLIPCFAEVSEGEKFATELLKYYRYETDQICLAVGEQFEDWEEYLGNDPDNIRYDHMYQVYYLNMKDTVAAYDTDGRFVDNISSKYYWVVPNYETGCEVQLVRNSETEYGWAIRRGTHYMDNIRTNYPGTEYGIISIYDNILENYPKADKLSFRFIYEELNDIHLMFFVSEGEEYVIPYFSSKDMTWIKNAEIYPVLQYIELVRKNTADDTITTALSSGGFDTETIYLNYIVVGTVAVIGIALTAVIVVKKKKQ